MIQISSIDSNINAYHQKDRKNHKKIYRQKILKWEGIII